ncbi:hypothetical protein TgHK011_000464 [Trichoderma gracile]|nr:hypothetical protein TgHK011_000464 [Trichoderma gracile]
MQMSGKVLKFIELRVLSITQRRTKTGRRDADAPMQLDEAREASGIVRQLQDSSWDRPGHYARRQRPGLSAATGD